VRHVPISTSTAGYHLYSPECVEGEFCDLRLVRVLGCLDARSCIEQSLYSDLLMYIVRDAWTDAHKKPMIPAGYIVSPPGLG
jgi:hypothetical protein